MMFVFVPGARAVSLEDVRYAVLNENIIKIESYAPLMKNSKIQTIWVHRTLKMKIFVSRTEIVAYDVIRKKKILKTLSTGYTKTTDISDEMANKVAATIAVAFGIPSSDINARWERVGPDVYDLFVKEMHFKVHLKPSSHLPQKIEWLGETEAERTYTLFSYPTQAQFDSILED